MVRRFDPSVRLCWQLGPWSLFQILCFPLSLSLPCLCSFSKINIKKIIQSLTITKWDLSLVCRGGSIFASQWMWYLISHNFQKSIKSYHCNRCRERIWQTITSIHDTNLNKVGLEEPYLNIIKAIYGKWAANMILTGEKLREKLLRSCF